MTSHRSDEAKGYGYEQPDNTLTERDWRRLGPYLLGYTDYSDDPDGEVVVYHFRGDSHWFDSGDIDAALIGVLTEMAQERGIEVQFIANNNASQENAARCHFSSVTIWINATPRQRLDCLLDALEAQEANDG